jgi:hypothetical protein
MYTHTFLSTFQSNGKNYEKNFRLDLFRLLIFSFMSTPRANHFYLYSVKKFCKKKDYIFVALVQANVRYARTGSS